MKYSDLTVERRKGERIASRCPLRYQFKGQTAFSDTITRDIGEGSIRFITNNFIPTFAELFLELSLRPSIAPIRVAAKVAWTQKVSHSDQYHVGARFTDIDEVGRKNIFESLLKYKKYPFKLA